jgi:hypothetical protein
MTDLLHLVESGAAIEIAILLTFVESFLLAALWRGRAFPILLGIAPGLCLMFALRASVAENWLLVGLWITLALPLHLADIRLRLKR